MASYTDFTIECARGDVLTLNVAVTANGVAKDLSAWTAFKLLAKSAKSTPEEDARWRLTDGFLDGITVTDAAGGLLTVTVPSSATRALEDKKGGRVLYTELYGTDGDGWVWQLATGMVTCFPLTWTKATAFSPKTVSGLTLWLRADQAVYEDAAFTTASVSTGSAVGGWKDKSGKNHHCVQEYSGALVPTRALNVLNGYPVVRGDATTQSALTGALTTHLWSGTAFTMFLVGSATAGGTGSVNDWPSWISTGMGLSLGAGSDGLVGLYNNGDNIGEEATALYTLGEYALIEARHGSGDIGLRVNGGIESTVASGETVWNDEGELAYLYLFGADARIAGDIAELLIWNVDLADADKASVRDYLTARYALDALRATVTKA